jgi:hypothetical protein
MDETMETKGKVRQARAAETRKRIVEAAKIHTPAAMLVPLT